jgi:tetratricopeptide (TPR) repeat protein
LRVTVKPHAHPSQELLTYEFTSRKPTEAVAELQWEELAVPFTIQVPNADDLYISHLNQELTSVPGFFWQGYQRAARFCLDKNTHLEQGLRWAEDSISQPGVGQANFITLSTKAELLSKMGRETEATGTIQTGLKLRTTTPLDIYQCGRKLLGDKKVDEAMTVFQYNASRFGGEWPVDLGLARGYSAKGDLKQALEHARKAVAQAPNPQNKQALEGMVKSLEAGKPI